MWRISYNQDRKERTGHVFDTVSDFAYRASYDGSSGGVYKTSVPWGQGGRRAYAHHGDLVIACGDHLDDYVVYLLRKSEKQKNIYNHVFLWENRIQTYRENGGISYVL